jgi:hypothetical protein
LKTRPQPEQTTISISWQLHFGHRRVHWKASSNPDQVLDKHFYKFLTNFLMLVFE